jgi:hypothetical protein
VRTASDGVADGVVEASVEAVGRRAAGLKHL